MTFAQQIARTAQRPIQQAARSFASRVTKASTSIPKTTSTAHKGGEGWLQSEGEDRYPPALERNDDIKKYFEQQNAQNQADAKIEESVQQYFEQLKTLRQRGIAIRDNPQQDYGRRDELLGIDTSNFKPKNALQNAFNKAHEQMQLISYNSGTVAAGIIMTEQAVTMYSCGDSTVGILFPQSRSKDGSPILLKPSSDGEVEGKNGAILRVGYNAFESKDNFPEVDATARFEKIYMDEFQELVDQHGPAMAVVASDGLHTKHSTNKKDGSPIPFNRFDFQKLKFHMLKGDKLHAKQQMFDSAAKAGNADNKTMYLDYVPSPEELQGKLINVAIFDGHGWLGATVAKNIAKSTISEIEKEAARSQGLSNDEKGISR